jgi:hypothetical protein
MYYNYTIFVAEVASTFNEQLLAHHLMKKTKKREELAALINHEVDSIRATIVRQTMFAEFEQRVHQMAESGQPLTVATIRGTYRELLEAYFGPKFELDDALSLECFRIPHFYRAFYVYKYATGLSAAIALSRKVLEGGAADLKNYLGFLKAGCSKPPCITLLCWWTSSTSYSPRFVAGKARVGLSEDRAGEASLSSAPPHRPAIGNSHEPSRVSAKPTQPIRLKAVEKVRKVCVVVRPTMLDTCQNPLSFIHGKSLEPQPIAKAT